jgi:hypothetical protein
MAEDDPWRDDPYVPEEPPYDKYEPEGTYDDPWADAGPPWPGTPWADEPEDTGADTHDPYHDRYPDIIPMPDEPGLVVAPASDIPNSEENSTMTTATTDTRPTFIPADGRIVVTLKQHGGFDSPWMVFHAEDVSDMAQQLEDAAMSRLAERVALAATVFASTKQSSAPAPRPQQAAPPVQQYQQPTQQSGGGDGRACHHGTMVFRSGTNKFNKPYSAYFCPSPKGTPDQCKAVFL